MKKAEQPVSDLLIEASNNAATLILKRHKLFRTGGSVFVGLLKKVEKPSFTWLKASIPVDDISRNGWDLAHETAARYKKELGHAPYIEPDKVGGRFDALNSAGRDQGQTSGAPGAGEGLGAFGAGGLDPQSIINSMMPQMGQFGIPNGIGIPGMPSLAHGGGFAGGSFGGGMPGFPGHGGHGLPGGADPFAAIGAGGFGGGRGQRGLPGLPQDPNKEIMDLLKGTGLGGEAKEISVPALHEVSGWDALPANTARMLEVEAAQLLLSQMPGVAPEMHGVKSLRALGEMEACSKALKRFLNEHLEAASQAS